ncbi:uncharacterized protein LOC144916201 isoform X2 [Branchiostoma floridae x Branchiostoma belcheri]
MYSPMMVPGYRTPLETMSKMLIDASPDFKTANSRLGTSERSCGTPVARTLSPTAFGSRRARGAGHYPLAGPGRRGLSTGRRRSTEELPGSSAGMVTGLDRGSAPRQPAWSAWIFTWNKIVNPRHAARDILLFYTEHQCRHIRLCPVRAKLPAPANDSGFRTVETISVHGEGFSSLRHVHPEMQTTAGIYWLARNPVVEGLGCAFMFFTQES